MKKFPNKETEHPEAKISKMISLQNKLKWYDYFVDYIYEMDSNKYNQACEFADKQTEQNDR
jgi:hypothetical protein|tara:strand:- start:427 stop:609 length:183 start_codon:yes stop_codon:yes gene_type:complete